MLKKINSKVLLMFAITAAAVIGAFAAIPSGFSISKVNAATLSISTSQLQNGTVVANQTGNNGTQSYTLNPGYIYKFEVYGAQGGSAPNRWGTTQAGGLGAYLVGYYDMRAAQGNTTAYYIVGNAGGNGTVGVNPTGGVGGIGAGKGGNGPSLSAGMSGRNRGAGGGGGGSSAIYINSVSTANAVLIAGGGGGAGGGGYHDNSAAKSGGNAGAKGTGNTGTWPGSSSESAWPGQPGANGVGGAGGMPGHQEYGKLSNYRRGNQGATGGAADGGAGGMAPATPNGYFITNGQGLQGNNAGGGGGGGAGYGGGGGGGSGSNFYHSSSGGKDAAGGGGGGNLVRTSGTYFVDSISGDAARVVNTTRTGNGQVIITRYVTCTHTWGTWTVVTPATCTTAGTEQRTCTNSSCGQTETRTIPAGHTFGSWTVTSAATCTTAGEEKRTCAKCNNIETRVIAALGHAMSGWEQRYPPCPAFAPQIRHCTRSGCTYSETRMLELGGTCTDPDCPNCHGSEYCDHCDGYECNCEDCSDPNCRHCNNGGGDDNDRPGDQDKPHVCGPNCPEHGDGGSGTDPVNPGDGGGSQGGGGSSTGSYSSGDSKGFLGVGSWLFWLIIILLIIFVIVIIIGAVRRKENN